MNNATDRKPNGPALAAFLASGIGSVMLGFLTTGAEASPALKNALKLNAGVGPLSGKTIFAVVAWLVSWALLTLLWRGKNVPPTPIVIATFLLIGLGFLGTFPIFFEAFTAK